MDQKSLLWVEFGMSEDVTEQGWVEVSQQGHVQPADVSGVRLDVLVAFR